MNFNVSGAALLALAAGIGFARAQGDLLERSPARKRDPGKPEVRDPIRPGATRQTLWFFFSTNAQGLPAEVERLGRFLRDHRDVELRPCLLVEDWDGVTHPASLLGETVKALSGLVGPGFAISLWDEEGLAMARELAIERTPAYALVSPPDRRGNGRAHVAYGIGADLKELVTCKER